MQCLDCSDLIVLANDIRSCKCTLSRGKLGVDTEKNTAITRGRTVIINIDYFSLKEAVTKRPRVGKGIPIKAYVLPANCRNVKLLKD